ncbi:MAG: 3'(2'),5'-bisphosphate nucleotidase CysQ, partial [Gammaproteobacteria bacterium]|nr:3'(2'),5'-bisphosphate nucleotidase CysQ [Gammaproteobacteria bacterium]
YPRFGLTSEWDTAAGQCVVEEAGGKVMNLSGEVLQYNTKESLLNPEFVVVGDPTYPWLRDIKALLSK